MMMKPIASAALAALCLGMLGACTTTKLDTRAQQPPQLLQKKQLLVGE
jgi:hypothetical protein